jgi:hypothetical protein
MKNCYSTGSVSGVEDVGGLVGYNYDGTITNCFWDKETSGQTTSIGGMGKTTAEMQTASTFYSWACSGESGWTIDEGKDYPRLLWENKPGELITLPSDLFGGGTGEPNDPYLIYTADQLNTIGLVSCHLDKHFLLCADIDLSGFTGTSFNIIGTDYYLRFTGVFDGNGHTISNFSYTSTDKRHIGLFGYVDDPDADIRNLGLIDPNVDTGTGFRVGSLVGRLRNGTIANCYSEAASITGSSSVGGLVGSSSGTITNCCSSGRVSGSEVKWGNAVGGLVGANHGTITNCCSNSSVSGEWYVGGLVGRNYSGTITSSYSTGSVSGVEDVGGLVGFNEEGTITNCYSTGRVTGTTYVGGLVGDGHVEVFASFWDIETSGQTSSAVGTGKTTAELQDANTFIDYGWGCSSVWTIDDGNDYPRLWWENKPGEPITVPSDLYGGGIGETDHPYLIYTAEQLNKIGLFTCHLDKHFKLMADIDFRDFTGASFNVIGTDWYNSFSGVFEGNGHTISNFSYTSTGRNSIGLFGYVSGKIKDLGLINPEVDTGTGWYVEYVGSLVGYLRDGTIANCYAEGGSVFGKYYVGGLVGLNSQGTISNCYSTVSISGQDTVGGLVGSNSQGTISNCYSTGSVSGDYAVGGLVGRHKYGRISNCTSSASVSGTTNVGGLVGSTEGEITNCYSTGGVSGYARVGGLVGSYWGSRITNCYSSSSVEGEWDTGGLVGMNYPIPTSSFWDIETSGQTTSAGGTGLPTAEMQMMSTFTDAGWDFVGETFNGIEDIWFIPQQDYPHLWWEGMRVPMKLTPVSLNCRSEGNWVKAHLTLPQGFTVEDVDPDRPAVLHSFGFQSLPPYVFVNKDKVVEIEATFERQAACSLAGDWPEEFKVAGFLADGNIFLGTSNIRIIHPGMKVIEDLAWYWLNPDCVHPDFCNEIDMNKDSIVNLLDYALLLNTQVEFVSE